MVRKKSKKKKTNFSKKKQQNPLLIDTGNLEKECIGQAPKFHQFSVELADARLEQDKAKADVDVTYAELDSDIRDDPDKYNIPKLSEGIVKATILQQSAYQNAVLYYNKTTHNVRILEAMVKALEHRRSALKQVVELRLSESFAEPSEPRRRLG